MKKTTILLIILLFTPALSNAADNSFYTGLGVSLSKVESTTRYDAYLLENQILKDNAYFAEIYFGFHFNNYFSLEIGYADLGEVDQVYTLSEAGLTSYFASNNREEIELSRVSVCALLEYPVVDEFSVFGLLGYSRLDIDRAISGPDGVDVGI